MKSFNKLAQSVKFKKVGSKILLNEQDPELNFIGKGRSAFVFKIQGSNKVLKIFFSPFIHLANEEAEIYKELRGLPFYPVMYDYGTNYLVIDYIEGNTLFNCLLNGIPISEFHIKKIDYALKLAKTRGLNPSDIHLRNIFITPNGNIKMIDVARFRQQKQCSQWNDLKTVYLKYYKNKFFRKKIPASFLNVLAFLYKKNVFHRTFTKASI